MLVYLQLMKYLKILIFTVFLLAVFTGTLLAQSNNTANFYEALASREISVLDQQLETLPQHHPKNKQTAYEGALRMKRAGLLKGPPNKLKEFKAGRELLEQQIKQFPDNAEFRFLRLMIQENAPRILGYYDNIDADLKLLQEQFHNLPASLKTIIADYSKTSRIIKPSDFKI